MSQNQKTILIYDEASNKEMKVEVSCIVAFQSKTVKKNSLLVAFMDDGNQYIML
ncbi:hypothetical protein L8C07_05550 [Paenibacillus sp. CMAA1739]|uniref:hypothetical protein n=1 Tax=Paenibacillus ottowii TaxID=2315729 RepID=UPI002DBC232C|nr:hypothetical protein [Paenibacillus sp. CMAA1739]MEC4565403.1 hypothetical protein [Paenibacillus sp. CMAA1739]